MLWFISIANSLSWPLCFSVFSGVIPTTVCMWEAGYVVYSSGKVAFIIPEVQHCPYSTYLQNWVLMISKGDFHSYAWRQPALVPSVLQFGASTLIPIRTKTTRATIYTKLMWKSLIMLPVDLLTTIIELTCL